MNKNDMSESLSAIGTRLIIDKDKNVIKKFIKHQCCSESEALPLYLDYVSNWENYEYHLE